jgi:hypothetical protein
MSIFLLGYLLKAYLNKEMDPEIHKGFSSVSLFLLRYLSKANGTIRE